MTADWNPDLYLRFEAERARPPVDLAANVDLVAPATVIDLGCGPGNSTEPLWNRWPGAEVTGLDLSPAMVEAARRRYPDRRWREGDARSLAVGDTFDLVFACASLQWLPDHGALVPWILDHVNPGGALAVQAPQFHRMPAFEAIDGAFRSLADASTATAAAEAFTFHGPEFYHDLLRPLATRLDLWETSYFHFLPSHRAVLDMLRSTALRPYLDRLDQERRPEFETLVLEGLVRAYPGGPGGVLFPFLRLFFVAYR